MLMTMLEVIACLVLAGVVAFLLYCLALVLIIALRNLIKEAKGGGDSDRNDKP